MDPAREPAPNVPAGAGAGLGTLIRYQPNPPLTRVCFSFLFTAAMIGFLCAALFLTRDVDVDCAHGDASFVVTMTYPLLGHRRTFLDLGAIRGTGLRMRRGKNGVLTYAVTLRTAAGEDVFSAAYAPLPGRLAQKRALDAFLRHPEGPPLHLAYDRGNPFGFLVGLFALVMVWVLWTIWQQATLRFEGWRRALVLERRRWPLAPWTRAFQLGEVAGVEVETSWSRRRPTYRLVLNLHSGEEVPLLNVRGSGLAYHEDLRRRISAELNRS